MNFLAALALVFSFHASSSDWFESKKEPGSNTIKAGKTLKKIESGKTENGFSAMIALTDELSILERWEKPSEGFTVKTTKKVMKGQYFLPLVFFRGAKVDGSGNTKVSYVLRIIKPDGQKYLEEMLEGWNGKASPAMNMVRGYVKMCFDPPDQFGKYKYIAFVRDEIGHTQLEIESEIELVKGIEKSKSALTDAELDKFMHFFYTHKNLKNFIPALQKLDQMPGLVDSHVPLMHFLGHIFAKNSSKFSHWDKDFSLLSQTMKEFIWDGMWLSNTKEGIQYLKKTAVNENDANKKYINELMAKTPPNLLMQPVLEPHDLDKNWISFFATGDQDYVLNVISALDFHSSNQKDQLMMKSAAKFSLTSNCEQHKKVKNILKDYLKKENRFSDYVKAVYSECLRKK